MTPVQSPLAVVSRDVRRQPTLDHTPWRRPVRRRPPSGERAGRFRLRTALAGQIVEGPAVGVSTAALSGRNDLVELWRSMRLYGGPVMCLFGRSAKTWFTAGLDPRAVAAAFAVLRGAPTQGTEIDFLRDVREAVHRVGRINHTESLRLLGVRKR